jgi:hypothetical protein
VKNKGKNRKVDRREELLARIFVAGDGMKKRENQLREKYAIFAHELQSAFRFTVGFANIYCEL